MKPLIGKISSRGEFKGAFPKRREREERLDVLEQVGKNQRSLKINLRKNCERK